MTKIKQREIRYDFLKRYDFVYVLLLICESRRFYFSLFYSLYDKNDHRGYYFDKPKQSYSVIYNDPIESESRLSKE